LPENTEGALIAGLTPGAPAERAGLQFSDVVVSINGEPIDSSTKLTRLVGAAKPGDALRMEIIRGGARQTVTVRAGTRPSETELNSQQGGGSTPGETPNGGGATVEGLTLAPLTSALRDRIGAPNSVNGLAITGVADGRDRGLAQGVVIQQVGSTPVRTVAEFRQAVEAARSAGRPGVYLLVWTRARGNVPYVLDLQKAE
jgi:serine protease Do